MNKTPRSRHIVPRFRVKLLNCLMAGLLVAVARLPAGSPPKYLSFQSTLVDSNGDAITDGNYTIYFRIYDASQSGTLVWSESQLVTVSSGYFSVFLGQGSAVSGDTTTASSLADVFKGTDAGERYVGITVSDTGTEISPRLQLLTSPYAFLATQATKLVDSSGNDILDASSGTVSLPSGAKAAGTLTVTGKLTAADDLAVGGAVTIDETLTTEGLTTANGGLTTTTLVAKGALTASAGMSTTTITASDTVTAKAGLTTTTLTASGAVTANAGLTTTKLTTSKDVLVGDDLFVTGGAVVTNHLHVKKDVYVGDDLFVTGGAVVTNRLYAKENVYVGDDLVVTNDTIVGGGLKVTNAVAFLDTLNVRGDLDADNGITAGIMSSDNVTDDVDVNLVLSAKDGNHWSLGVVPDNATGTTGNYKGSLAFARGTSVLRVFKTNGNADQPSDRRLKKNVEPIEGGVLRKLERLPVVSYHLKTQSNAEPKTIGFIAQDVARVFPSLVSPFPGGYLGMSYDRIGVIAVAAIKEIKAEKDQEISSLRDENNILKQQLNEVLQRLQALESRVK